MGVALGVALVMLFTGLTRGMSNDLQRRSANLRSELIFTRPGSIGLTFSSTNVSTGYVERLKQIDGVEDATPVIKYFYPSGTFGVDQVEGVDWDAFSRMNGINLIKGQPPRAPDEVVIDEFKASRNHPVGSELRVFGNRPYRVVGIYSPESGARVKMTIASLQDALETRGKCTYILVKCKDPNQQLAVVRRIEEQLPGNKVQATRDIFPSIETAIPGLGIFLRALVGVASVLSALVVMLAMYTTITERAREIGILKAMGASRGYIVSE